MAGDHEFTEDDQGHVVPAFVEQFDWSQMDTLEDELRQALSEGRSVAVIVAQLVDMEATQRTADALARALCLIADAHKPKLVIDQLAYVAGLHMNQGASITELAKRHGQHKQQFSAAALRLMEQLRMSPSRQMRSLKARTNMAKAFRERANDQRAKTKTN